MEASGDSNSSAFAPRPATHPLPALPLQAVPVTLAPFVLMPDATPLLPSLNIQPTAQKSLRDVLPSLSGTVMDAAQSDALTRNIEAVLNTKPTIIPQEYVLERTKARHFQSSRKTDFFCAVLACSLCHLLPRATTTQPRTYTFQSMSIVRSIAFNPRPKNDVSQTVTHSPSVLGAFYDRH